jgi:SAM-dependent methyltransferase
MAFDYDAELVRYNEIFRTATDIEPGDQVLDIGCGTGQSTRDAAIAAAPGTALGVDISADMLDVARQHSAGLPNVAFELADAERHPFPTGHFTVAISRFGTMFFADPLAAFTNIARAAPRLVMLVWQESSHQDWTIAIRDAFAPGDPLPTTGAFSLADPAIAKALLNSAGYPHVAHTDLREPVYYGPDPAAARDAVLGFRMSQDQLAALPESDRQPALDRLHHAMAAHQTSDGVWFDSRAWLITATRP